MHEDALTLSVEEAGRMVGIGRTVAFRMVRNGVIPALHLGRKWRIPRRALEELLAHPERLAAKEADE